MKRIEELCEVGKATKFLTFDTTSHTADNLAIYLSTRGLSPRVLRGREMRTEPDLYREFAAALQFPLYFGQNKAAFDDCMGDLFLVPRNRGIVLVISDPGDVLRDGDHLDLAWFVDALQIACNRWSEPVEDGAWWDRPPVPFHVVVAAPTGVLDATVRLWSSLGADFDTLHPDPGQVR